MSIEPIVWSYGGGTQTAAIAVLIAQGRLPKPDRIVCADTGREVQATWDYMNDHIQPLLAPLGLTIEVIPHTMAPVDLYDRKGKGILIPAYTKGNGRLNTYCSSEWKKTAIRRHLKQTGVTKCVMWLGMSTDEVERLKMSDVQWIKNEWPLCFMVNPPLSRVDCIQLVTNYGLPRPPKSACWMCPQRDNPGWQEMKETAPDDFAKAIQFDKEHRNDNGGIWLHEDRKPLDEIDFANSQQPPLFGCEHGMCWT